MLVHQKEIIEEKATLFVSVAGVVAGSAPEEQLLETCKRAG